MYQPIANSYFSGAGLFDIGLMMGGVKIQQSIDVDPAATDCMKSNPHYFGHSIITGAIEDKIVLEQPYCDVMAFTYPCTKYSSIADIHGARTGDHLFLHALRHVAVFRPEMYVIENVPGMKKFKVVMEAMTKPPDYYVNVFCPVKACNWVPQRRDRLIVIASKKSFFIEPPTQVSNRPRIKDLLEKDVNIDFPEHVIARLNGKYRDKPIIVDPEQPGAVAPTCVAHYHKDQGTRLVKDNNSKHGVRPFTVREYARLQGVPDDVRFPDSRIAYKLIGNGVECNTARWVGKQIVRYFN